VAESISGSSTPFNWQVTLWSMVCIQFVMSMALTAMSPIYPLMLPGLGVSDPDMVKFLSGMINSAGFIIAAIVSPLWGQIADRRGRKLMVLRSSCAICVFTALMGLSQHVWQLMALRGLMGAFSGFSAAAIALVASQVPEDRLGSSLGWLSTGQLTGSLLGPLIGGFMADLSGSFRMTFMFTSLMAGVVLVLAWGVVRENFIPGPARQKRSMFGSVRMLARVPGVLPLMGVLLMAQFGVRTVQPVVTLFVQELVASPERIATLAGFAFSVTGMADLLASPFLGKRSDTIGYRKVLLISLAGAAIMTVPQAFVHGYWSFVAERFGVGMFVGGVLPTANALIGRMVAAQDRGLVYGLTASATFMGGFLGPFTGGSVAAIFGIRTVFLVTAAIMAMNWVWVFLVVPKTMRDGTPS
jgi:DHA1 family multidrug resistance protein-like MFS transporter